MRILLSSSGVALFVLASIGNAAGGSPVYPACKDKSVISRAIDLIDEGDFRAADEIFRRGLKNKDCRYIPAARLIIETTPPLSRVVQVHERGDPDVYWINNAQIQ